MAADNLVTINEAAVEWLTNSPDGPVGRFIEEKTIQMTAAAVAAAPIQKPQNYSWGPHSTSYMPRSSGYLKSMIKPHFGYTRGGTIFGGVNAPFGPTVFLQKPADQLHHSYPFMTTALYSVTI